MSLKWRGKYQELENLQITKWWSWKCSWISYCPLKEDTLISSRLRSLARYVFCFSVLTAQWALLLMSTGNPDHIIHGVKILARLLVTQGSGYVSKFSARVHGFPVLRHNLAPWWY